MTPPYFLAIIEKILQKVILFFSEKREEKIKPWFWHVWIAQWLTFFCNTYFFSMFAIFRGKRGVKFGPNVLTLGPFLFHENSNFSNDIFSARLLSLVRILIILDHIWGSRGPKITPKGHFVHAEPVSKALKIFDWTTTNAILMKLTTVM